MRFSASISKQQAHPIIHLKDKEMGCTATIYAFGGLLNAFSIPINNKIINCVSGYQSVAEARKTIADSFAGAKLSPFVCRMRDGIFRWNEKNYKVHKHYLGAHAIHGLVYDMVYDISQLEATNEYATVVLVKKYDATDQGYPFPYSIELKWTLENNNHLSITTTVRHENKEAIPYADGWHPYFSLGGKIDDSTLQFDATQKIIFDDTLLPTGELQKDDRFESGLLLKDISLDNSFILNPTAPADIILSNKNITLHVQPSGAYPILQVYTPPHRRSIAIENLSGTPDNFNNQIGLLVLEPNKDYSFSTVYKLSVP